MKLFHITTNLNHSGLFVPSIPFFRLKDEEATIKRVSTSFSIEGALTAMPRGGFLLQETLKENEGKLRILELDVVEAGIQINDLILPYALFQEGWVEDALITEEVWVLKSFQAQRMIDVQLLDWQEYEDDIYPEWMNKTGNIPVITKIENIQIKTIKETRLNEEKKIFQQNLC